jgi:tetratricopeptide (TPR) repeat protein
VPRKHFNWKLIAVLLIGSIVIGITGYGLRQWQRGHRAESGLALGNQAYAKQDWEAAAKYLGRYIAMSPNDVDAFLKYADAQLNIRPLQRNNIEQAVGAYRNVLRVEETNSKAAETLVGIYLQIGLPGEAQLISTRAISKNPSVQLRRMLAIALIEQRKFDEAFKELTSLIKDQPDYLPAYDEMGRLAEKRPEKTSETPQYWFDQAVKTNPSDAVAYIVRASYYLRKGDKSRALADLTEAQKQKLSDSMTRLRLAEVFIDADVTDAAQTHLQAVMSVDPSNQTLWQIWSRLALKTNDVPMMKMVAGEGLKALSLQSWDFMPIAAELYLRSGEIEMAEKYITQLRQKEIAPATTEFLDGLVTDRKGQHYEAVKHLYQAIQLGNNSAAVRMELSNILSKIGDKQSAIQQLRILSSQYPQLTSARLALARLLSETGNWDEASQLASAVKEVLPGDFNASMILLQTQIQILSQNQTQKDSPLWREVEDRLAKLEKESENKLPVNLLQFQVAVLQSRFDVAGQMLEGIKTRFPSRIEVAMAQIELMTAQDQIEQAIQKLSDTIKEFPESVSVTSYLVTLLAERNERQKCETVIQDSMKKLKEPGARRQLGLLLADLYNRWNQQEKRYQFLNSLVAELPDDIVLYSELLKCPAMLKDPQSAQKAIDKIKLLEGENGYRWRYEQAKLWVMQEDRSRFKTQYPQSVSLLKANLQANPEDQASRMVLAMAYERAAEMQLAISTYLEALDRSPRNMNIIISTVAALYKVNEYDRADKILSQATQEKLFSPELERLQFQNFIKRGQLNSAGDILENLLRNDPNNESICLSLTLLKIRQNKFADASILLNKLKTQKPDSVIIAAAEVEWNIRQNQRDQAMRICDGLVEKLQNTSAYILRARTRAILGQVDNAILDLDYAVTHDTGSIEALVMRSDILGTIGQLDKAILDIQKAMTISADNIQLKQRAIMLYLASGDAIKIQQGREILENALVTNPQSIELRIYKARYLLAQETAPAIAEAQTILQKITEESPKMSQAWALLAEISFRLKQTTSAADIILRGLVYQPNDTSLLMLKAQLEAKSSPLLAIPTLKALLDQNPDDLEVVVRLADIYISAGEPSKAIAVLKTKLASTTGAADIRKLNILLAVALYKTGDKVQSQEQFNSLVKSAPDNPEPMLAQIRLLEEDKLWDILTQKVLDWYQVHPKDVTLVLTIARKLAASGNMESVKAVETILQAILKNDSGNMDVTNVLAMLLQVSGRPQEAAELYQRIVTAQPDNLVAINNLAWILCEDQNLYDKALALAQQGIAKSPTDYVDLIDTRGTIYYRMGQFEKSAQDFNQCIKLYPEGTPALVTSHFHLAKTLIGLGKKEESIKALNQALKLNNDFGGLSPTDLAEAKRLVREMSGGV